MRNAAGYSNTPPGLWSSLAGYRKLALAVLLAGLALSAAGPATAQRSEDPPAIDAAAALSEYTKGVFLLESDEPREAIHHLESAWTLSGKDQGIGSKLSEAYFQVGELSACERLLDELIAGGTEDGQVLVRKAKIEYLRGERRQAIDRLEQARELSSPSFEIEQLIGRIQFELGDDRAAAESYAHALRIDGSYPFIHYKYGLLLRKLGRRDEAEAELREAVQLQPHFADAVVELAGMLIEDERIDEAERVLTDLLQGGDDFVEALLMVANLYAETGRLDDAIRALEAHAQRDTLPREGVLLLAKCYYEAHDYDEAFRIFASVFENESDSPELARVLGEISLKSGKPAQALEYYRRAITISPQDYRNYMALFFASASQFREKDAGIIDLSDDELRALLDGAAARIEADDFDATYVIGVAYQSLDAFGESRKLLERAVALRPDDDKALLNLASALEQLGLYPEAVSHLEKLHSMKPDDPTICNFYGYVLTLLARDLDKAEDLIQTALKHEPDNGYYMDSLGWLYFKRGEYDKAIMQLEEASDLVKDDPVILEHLGDAYRSSRRYRKALAVYEHSLDLQGDNADIRNKIDDARRQIGD